MSRLILILLLALAGCTSAAPPVAGPAGGQDTLALTPNPTPDWAKEAIWYQIFVERFRNGDPTNDPTLPDIEGSWPHLQPAGWRPTPWTHDWYAQEDWAGALGEPFYLTVQARRYGGDLQGVLDRLDDLAELGVTALYFNPINDAPSLHKYDARTYRHIDRNFGPDPRGDEALVAKEDPADPATWTWTAADRLFLDLIEEAHQRGMRVILDYSWNHTGITFWAWRDVLEKQQASRYADWYQVTRFDDPATPDTSEFAYEGWAGVRELPNLTKVGVPADWHGGPAEGDLHPEVKQHIFNVTRRWLDPNGDGDPSDGIDGFRLDVAEQVPLGFWRDYRRFVKGINPEAYLVGEIWWEQWPVRMMDPKPYLGDVFDAVMNYRWYMPTRSFFAGALPRETARSYIAHLDSVEHGIPRENLLAMMNLTASHDSPRFATSIYNRGRYKYGVNPRDNPDYRIGKPDAETKRLQKLVLVQQFTYYGAPHIWNGDEVGMWGADDPDNRKPLVWTDLIYEPEAADPFGRSRPPEAVAPDLELRDFYHQLIALRKAHQDLFVYGDLRYLLADDDRRLLAYSRTRGDEQALVVFNAAMEAHEVDLPIALESGTWHDALVPSTRYTATNGILRLVLAPQQALVLLKV